MVNNLGTSFENIIVIILFFGSFIFFAKDFKLGMIFAFLKDGLVFMWFYNVDLSYAIPTIMMFLDLVIICLALYLTMKTVRQGALI